VNDELERIWKEEVLSLKHCPQFAWRDQGKPQNTQNIPSPGPYFYPGPSEYEPGVLTTLTRVAILLVIFENLFTVYRKRFAVLWVLKYMTAC
jgi:hypothetical protein